MPTPHHEDLRRRELDLLRKLGQIRLFAATRPAHRSTAAQSFLLRRFHAQRQELRRVRLQQRAWQRLSAAAR